MSACTVQPTADWKFDKSGYPLFEDSTKHIPFWTTDCYASTDSFFGISPQYGSGKSGQTRVYICVAPAATGSLIFAPHRDIQESSTLATPHLLTADLPDVLELTDEFRQFKRAFELAAEERFEDGLDSELSKELEKLVKNSDSGSRRILLRLLDDPCVSAEVWAEAMRWVGRADEYLTRESRALLLEAGLASSSAHVRDGAILGVASMDDPELIPVLEHASEKEKNPGLRLDIQQVLGQLRSH